MWERVNPRISSFRPFKDPRKKAEKIAAYREEISKKAFFFQLANSQLTPHSSILCQKKRRIIIRTHVSEKKWKRWEKEPSLWNFHWLVAGFCVAFFYLGGLRNARDSFAETGFRFGFTYFKIQWDHFESWFRAKLHSASNSIVQNVE